MNVVLDTNILVSGIARPHGAPGQIVTAWFEGAFELVVSEELLDEIRRVMSYPRIRKLMASVGLSDKDLEDFVDILRFKAVTIDTTEVVLPVQPRDDKDIPVLEAFVASKADYLVTGDKKHLLSLGLDNIITANDFASRIRALKSMAPRM
jgi:uncharacterized protein